MDKPCMGCTERHLGCHDHCERYKAMVVEIHAVEAARREAKASKNMIYGVSTENPHMKKWRRDKIRGKVK